MELEGSGNSAAMVRMITALRHKLQTGRAGNLTPNFKGDIKQHQGQGEKDGGGAKQPTGQTNLKQATIAGEIPVIDDIYDSRILTKPDHVLQSIRSNINYFSLMVDFKV